jgi:hypothetical protein
VTMQIGIQAQQNNGVRESPPNENDGEENHNDVDTNNMLKGENINQVDGTNICNQRAPHEKIAIANVHCSSANNASIYTRMGQVSVTVINVDDDDSTTEDDNQPKCAICNNGPEGRPNNLQSAWHLVELFF